ncbi:MAG: phenylacetate--CoA ligase family protein [Candidatus Altiarchaeales archaeon]|nr:phenylacetate--CoA ligase family protein [Candidatus Altiarchaeales archaeon]
MIYDKTAVRTAYKHSPVVVQNMMLTAYGMLKWLERNNSTFKSYARELDESQWYSKKQLEELQNKKLQMIVKHAYENVPYYHRVFDENKLKPEDIKTKEDLGKLPYLTRGDVKKNFKELTAVNVPKQSYFKAHTGGTTGDPLSFLLDKRRLTYTRALQWRHWTSLGYRFRSKLAFMRAASLMPPESNRKPFWRHDFFENKLFLSAYHVDQEKLRDYAVKIVQWKPEFLFTYPLSACILAKFMKKECVEVALKAVFTGSETLFPEQRRIIEEAFKCKVYDEYGHAERAVRAGQCSKGSYHIDSEYGILQVQKDDCDLNPGETGEIIATSLSNYSMPLIRYRTGDTASLADNECACGRGLPLVEKIEGKFGDWIATKDGRMVRGILVSPIMGEFSDTIKEWQITQRNKGALTVNVIPEEEFNGKQAVMLVKRLKDLLGVENEIEVKVRDRIDRTKSGKFRCVVSEVEMENI